VAGVKKPQLTRWRVTLGALGLLVVLVAAVSLNGSPATITAPRSAAPGQLIHVTARRLRSATYSLVLVAGRTPPGASYCTTVLGRSAFENSEQRFAVRVPATIPCFHGRSADGSVAAGGEDQLVVGVPENGGFSYHATVVRRALAITT
jgi:hypothetical protein